MSDIEREREAFEAWEAERYYGNAVAKEAARLAWLARAERAEQRTLPGYVLVPVEPTEAMVEAGIDEFKRHDFVRFDEYYRAMLAAAPPQAEQREPLKDADVLAHAARFGDAETDSRGRVTYSFDSYGLVALAAALVGAPKTAEQREPLTGGEHADA